MATLVTLNMICQDELGLTRAERNRLLHETKEFRSLWETQNSINLIECDFADEVAPALLKEMAREWLDEGSIQTGDGLTRPPIQFFWENAERKDRMGEPITYRTCKTKILEEVQQVFLKQHQNRISNRNQKRRPDYLSTDISNTNALHSSATPSPNSRCLGSTTPNPMDPRKGSQECLGSTVNSDVLGPPQKSALITLKMSRPIDSSVAESTQTTHVSFETESDHGTKDGDSDRLTGGKNPRSGHSGAYNTLAKDKIHTDRTGIPDASSNGSTRPELVRKAPSQLDVDVNNAVKRQRLSGEQNGQRHTSADRTEQNTTTSGVKIPKDQGSPIESLQPSARVQLVPTETAKLRSQNVVRQHTATRLSSVGSTETHVSSDSATLTTSAGDTAKVIPSATHSIAPWAASLANTPISPSTMHRAVLSVKISPILAEQQIRRCGCATCASLKVYSTTPLDSQAAAAPISTAKPAPDRTLPRNLSTSTITLPPKPVETAAAGVTQSPLPPATGSGSLRILVWVQASPQPALVWRKWDSPKLFLKHSVVELFTTVKLHTNLQDFNCIVARLDLPITPSLHYEFKIRRNESEKNFEMVKKHITAKVKASAATLALQRTVEGGEGGPRTDGLPAIGEVILWPIQENENVSPRDGKEEEWMF
ncbi:MAG: Mucin-12 [Icmadophila ericetorum]|nr:Mucin-12 [Icmadophila ericetorum]